MQQDNIAPNKGGGYLSNGITELWYTKHFSLLKIVDPPTITTTEFVGNSCPYSKRTTTTSLTWSFKVIKNFALSKSHKIFINLEYYYFLNFLLDCRKCLLKYDDLGIKYKWVYGKKRLHFLSVFFSINIREKLKKYLYEYGIFFK